VGKISFHENRSYESNGHKSSTLINVTFRKNIKTVFNHILINPASGLKIYCILQRNFFLFSFGVSGTESNITDATTELLHQPRIIMMDDERGSIGGMLGR
jgi:hypothetical protein